MSQFPEIPAKRALTTISAFSGLIKGEAAGEGGDDLAPAFSASGQDVWVPRELARATQPGIVLSAVGARCGKVFEAKFDRWATVANTSAWAISPGWDPHFVYYLFNREDFWIKGGAAQPYVQVGPSLSQLVSFPPLEDQRMLADYLDVQTAKIDALIGKQEQLIETLAERRQAVISHAVSKGLDPNAPMKNSGQKWLGQVPRSWRVTSLKRTWRVIDCKHVTAEFVSDGIPLASIREAQSKWVDLSAAKQTTEEFYWQLIDGGRRPREGDLIFTRNATVGAVSQVPAEIERFAVGQDVCILRSMDSASSPDYQQYLLQSWVVSAQIETLLLGSTFKRINVEQIRDFVLPAPGGTEQSEIAGYLDDETAKIDALSAKAREMIDMLKERRQALISAAVTGKIDVRGLT